MSTASAFAAAPSRPEPHSTTRTMLARARLAAPASASRRPTALPSARRARASRAIAARAGKKRSIFEEMLDVMEGGPKLRRWYGSDSSVGDGTGATSDENGDEDAAYGAAAADDEDVELNLPKTSILVTDADGALGESIVMQLILAKASVVAACEAERIVGAETRFGPYVNVVSNSTSAGARLNGVRAVVVTDALEEDLLAACARRGVKHVVLVSSAKSAGGGLFPSANEKARRDKTREELAKRSGVALTIIRPCSVKSSPSQGREIRFGQGDTLTGEVSIEDLAETVARALTRPPKPGKSLEFEVSNGAGVAERDWKALFAPLV